MALVAATAAAAAFVCAPAIASAADYVVHVHGRTQATWTNTMYSISGYASVKCDYEAKYNTLAQSNATVRACLAQYCSGAATTTSAWTSAPPGVSDSWQTARRMSR